MRYLSIAVLSMMGSLAHAFPTSNNVPEPSTLMLVGIGAVAMVLVRGKRK